MMTAKKREDLKKHYGSMSGHETQGTGCNAVLALISDLEELQAIVATAGNDRLIEVAEMWEKKGLPCREDIRFTYFEFARKLRIIAESAPSQSPHGLTSDPQPNVRARRHPTGPESQTMPQIEAQEQS